MLDQTSPLAPIYALIQDDLAKTDAFILEQLSTKVPFIKALGEHILKSGGKRLRPVLLLSSAKLFDYQGEHHIALAAVIEFIHTATLLHDDVIDGSDLRRGKKTANSLWGNEASILVGDFLYSRTFQMIVKTENLKAMAILGDATNRLAEGEVLQLLHVNKTELTEAHYYDIIDRKTATLFAAASEIGAVLAEQSADTQAAIKTYGYHLGMAFQLIDDMLDYTSHAAGMGKNPGDDLAKGKLTLPLIYALQQAEHADQAVIEKAIADPTSADFKVIVNIIEKNNAIDYVKQQAKHACDKAIAALGNLPDNDYRDALRTLALFTVKREF